MEERKKPYKDKDLINQKEAQQKALKILSNAGYGLFGEYNFKYYNYRTANLITGYGRLTLKKIKQLAETYRFQVVYGFTDSIFIKGGTGDKICEFISDVKSKYNVELEHKQTYHTSLFFGEMNRYILLGKTNEPELLNLDGTQSKYPKWLRENVQQIAKHVITSAKNEDGIIQQLDMMYSDLDNGSINIKYLQYSEKLSKEPTQYKNNDKKKVIGIQQNLGKGDVIYYYDRVKSSKYEGDNSGSWTTNYNEISLDKYKRVLWEKLLPILEIAGYDVELIKSKLKLHLKN